MKIVAVLLSLLLALPQARAWGGGEVHYDGPESWSDFEAYMKDRENSDRIEGMSYIVGGSIATLGGLTGYYSSTDVLSRGVFAVSQTLGVVSIGYGASVYWNGNDYSSFFRAVRDSSLSQAQKTEVLRNFLENEREARNRARWIGFGTQLLLATVNFYSASKEGDRDLRNLFQFMGFLNIGIAFAYVF